MANNREERGSQNPTQGAYDDTVADYSQTIVVDGDNIITDVTCDSSVAVGDVVRMSGGVAVRAIATTTNNSKAIGICVSKSDATTCNIQVTGFTSAVFVGLSESENYYLSSTTPGAITTSPPTGASQVVLHIGRAYTSTQLIVQIGQQYKRAP